MPVSVIDHLTRIRRRGRRDLCREKVLSESGWPQPESEVFALHGMEELGRACPVSDAVLERVVRQGGWIRDELEYSMLLATDWYYFPESDVFLAWVRRDLGMYILLQQTTGR